MAEQPQSSGASRSDEPRPVGGDLILPLAGLVFTIYYFVTIWDLTWEAQVNGFFVGSVLIVLILIYLARTARDVISGRATLGLGGLARPLEVQVKRGALLLLSIAFIWLLQWLGFTLATGLFLFAALYVLGVRDRRQLIGLPLALSLGGYVLFIALLQTRFPHGIVERLLGSLY